MTLLYTGRNLVLTGPMGAGKSAVGGAVAQRLGRPFTDTDERVEAEAGRSVAVIFSEEGERAFRAVEAEVVRAVSAVRGQVIAVGGGAVTDPANVTHLRGTGDVVWLDADGGTLAARIGDPDGRPLLAGAADLAARLDELRAEREPAYRAAAHQRIDTTDLDVGEVVEAVLAWAERRPGLLTREERAGLGA